MKGLICLIISLISFDIGYGQFDIQMIPIKHQKKITIKDDQLNKMLFRYNIYSENDRNLAAVEVYQPDSEIEEKAQRDIIKLFDQQGNLLGISGPVELYDWYVKPLGDNETVLVTLIGITDHSYIDFYKIIDQNLVKTNHLKFNTGTVNFTSSLDGTYVLTGSSYPNEKNIELSLYNNNALQVWSVSITDADVRDLKILKELIVVTTKDFEPDSSLIYVFNKDGKLLMKELTGGRIGDYELAFSDDEENRYFATASDKQIFLYDSKLLKRINVIEPQLDGGVDKFLIDKNGTVIGVNNNGIFIETFDQQNICKKVDFSPYVIHLSKEGAKIILEEWSPEASKFFEIQYNK